MYLYPTRAGFEIGRVSRNGSVLSSISSRINAVAFTRVTKIRTTCRNNGIMSCWKSTTSNVTTWAPAKESVRITGTNARRPVAIARRVVKRYRTVRPVTTHAFRNDSVQSIPSPDEIPEHGVEAVVRTLESADVELRVRDDLRELLVERVRFAGADEECVGGRELEGDEVLHPGQGLGKLTRFRRLDPHGVRMGVDERADRVDVAGRDRLAIVNQDDVVRDPFDLIEDMGRHQHMAAVFGEVGDRLEDMDAPGRVCSGVGLVEDQDLRVVGKSLGELRALAHSATITLGRPLGRVGEADDLQGGGGLRARICRGHSVEPQERLHELLSGEPSVELVLLRTIAQAPLQWDVVPRVFAEQRDLALVGVELADEELEQRALARPVGPDKAGDSFAERCGERVEAEHLAVPLRDTRGLHHAVHPEITSTAFIRMYVTIAARTVTPSNIESACGQSIPAPDAPNAAIATAK